MSARALTLKRLAYAAPLAAVLLSCDAPGPAAPDLHAPRLAADEVGPTGNLVPCRPMAYDSVTQTVGFFGAVLRVGHHTLVIPPLALTQPVTITVVVPSDTVNVIRLEPEGLVFNYPVRLTMSYANCNAGSLTDLRKIAYATDSLQIIEYEPSVDNVIGKRVTTWLPHFSLYAVSW